MLAALDAGAEDITDDGDALASPPPPPTCTPCGRASRLSFTIESSDLTMVPRATVPPRVRRVGRRCCAWSMPSMSRTACRAVRQLRHPRHDPRDGGGPGAGRRRGRRPGLPRFPAPTAPRRATATARCRSSAGSRSCSSSAGRQHAGLHPPTERLPPRTSTSSRRSRAQVLAISPSRWSATARSPPGRLRLPAAGRHGEAGGQALRHPRPRRLLPALDLRGRRRRHDPPRPPGGRRPLVPPTSNSSTPSRPPADVTARPAATWATWRPTPPSGTPVSDGPATGSPGVGSGGRPGASSASPSGRSASCPSPTGSTAPPWSSWGVGRAACRRGWPTAAPAPVGIDPSQAAGHRPADAGRARAALPAGAGGGEEVPLRGGAFDLVISEYGAAIWAGAVGGRRPPGSSVPAVS